MLGGLNLKKNWIKLNSVGLAMGNPGLAGGGGIIRDKNGAWLARFARAIGTTASVEAELWAVRDGLQLCKTIGIQALKVDLDAKIVVDWLVNPLRANLHHSLLISDYRDLVTTFLEVSIKHCFREVNHCASRLAKASARLQ